MYMLRIVCSFNLYIQYSVLTIVEIDVKWLLSPTLKAHISSILK